MHKILRYLLAAGLLAANLPGHGQNFNRAATSWRLPAGGYATAAHNYSYNAPGRTAASAAATDHTWLTMDINGDHRPDMVVCAEGTGSHSEAFGTSPGGRYWKVHLGTSTGFAATATTWSLPAGGGVASGSGRQLGFNGTSSAGSNFTGNQSWNLADLDGDGRPDLLVTSEGTGNAHPPFGSTTAGLYWKVYRNTGTGFAPAAFNWPLPPAGAFLGNQVVYYLDINGDQRQDMVVTSNDVNTYGQAYGSGLTGRYWNVYLNSGTGFASTATPWVLPAGGYYFSSAVYCSFNRLDHEGRTFAGSQGWVTQDITGDGKPDLVVSSEGTGSYSEAFGTGPTGRFWKVYPNTGTGFATTAITWSLPAGGLTSSSNGHFFSFNNPEAGGSAYLGDQRWTSLLDLNGDGRLDLTVLAQGTGSLLDVFGTGPVGRSWKTYLNTGSGFAATATTCALPPGGLLASNGHNFSFIDYGSVGSSRTGDQSWSMMDLNGDNWLDLVVISEGSLGYNDVRSDASGYYWRAYLNAATTTATTAASPQPALRAYPNPTPDRVVLESPATLLGQPYQLADCLGRPLLQGRLTAVSQPLDLSSLAPGVYMLLVSGQAGRGQRIVKQ